VGGGAARLLAELALVDTDQALRDGGITATRFVDDFRIFLRNSESPYDALGFLAEHLAINEGLSLNAAKTSVSTRSQYILSRKPFRCHWITVAGLTNTMASKHRGQIR
jgi:hypothetical protein